MSETTYPNYSPGLQGVIGGITSISKITVEESKLEYRGYNVHDLASQGSFEETAYLLLKGELPNAAELAEFNKQLDAERSIPAEVVTALKACAKGTHPMDMLKVAYSVLSGFDPDYGSDPTDHDANIRQAIRILAKAPTVVTAAYQVSQGKEPIAPKPGLRTASNFLYMLHGEEQDDYTELVMDASLTLYAEHT